MPYCAQSGSDNLDSARQSEIEGGVASGLQAEHHSQIGKSDDKDRFDKVVASPNPTAHNLSAVRHVMAVAAGKGGVGKSTLSLNLALHFAGKGAKVGILDADLYGPSLKTMLPEGSPPYQHEERIIPAVSCGIKWISMAHFLQEAAPASVRAPIANGVIKQFLHLVEWGDLDYLIIDFPPGTGDIQLTLVQEGTLSGAVIVGAPQEIALLDVSKAVAMFREMQVPLIGLVENMSYYRMDDKTVLYPFGKGGGERFAQENRIYFLGGIPVDPEISRCCDQAESIFSTSPESEAALNFASIAEKVADQLESFEKLEQCSLKNFDLQWKR